MSKFPLYVWVKTNLILQSIYFCLSPVNTKQPALLLFWKGDQSCVLIDTLESHEAAQEALVDIKKVINDKPIDAIILTHFHADHTGEFFWLRTLLSRSYYYAIPFLNQFAKRQRNLQLLITNKFHRNYHVFRILWEKLAVMEFYKKVFY